MLDVSNVANGVPALRRAAMDYLARREHSTYELRTKLQRRFKEANTDSIADVLAALQTEKLQSDERFVESYVRYRRNRGFGPRYIEKELRNRRVSDSIIGQFVDEQDSSWQVCVQTLIEKRCPEGLHFNTKPYQKLYRYLESRGFSHGQIRTGLDRHLRAFLE